MERGEEAKVRFLSTLPVRGATDALRAEHRLRRISIHAPREGSDKTASRGYLSQAISIHAPREGSDSRIHTSCETSHYFYPRSP